MGIFDFLSGSRKLEVAPYERQNLGEEMELTQEERLKPCYLVDKRANTKVEFFSADWHFCTVKVQDIDWDSLVSLNEDCKKRARELDIRFPTRIDGFKNGVAKVIWQLNPDGRYYMDDDGFGMTNDVEINIYGFIDRQGTVVSKFRYVNGNRKLLDEMREEAEGTIRKRIRR